MMMRLDTPTLILVPNLTLEEQWKDNIEKILPAYQSQKNLLIELLRNKIS